MDSEQIYSEIILDYYRHPKNKGMIENADAHFKDWNPLCGDEIEIFLKFKNGKVSEAKFSGSGCAISQAAASMLTELIQGKTADELKKMKSEEVLSALGVKLTPIRVKCALLGFAAMQKAIYSEPAVKP